MTSLDLNARRAARREAGREHLKVNLGDDEFLLPPELPIDIAEPMKKLADGDLTCLIDIVETLFGDDTDRFMKYRPSIDDLEQIIEAYGTILGESSASTESSNPTSTP